MVDIEAQISSKNRLKICRLRRTAARVIYTPKESNHQVNYFSAITLRWLNNCMLNSHYYYCRMCPYFLIVELGGLRAAS